MTKAILADVQVILFDFDGTLYEETAHFDFYAEQLARLVPAANRSNYWETLTRVVEGRHPIRFGTVVDLARSLVLTHTGGTVTRVTDCDGVPMAEEQWQGLYTTPLVPVQGELHNVGDLWQVAPLCAIRHGADRGQMRSAFVVTREWMCQREMIAITGLVEQLAAARSHYRLVFATNSPQPDSQVILAKLGLAKSFDHYVFSANKPQGFGQLVQEIMTTFKVRPEQIASVGDNMLNEITPARALGMRTVFIDRHRHGTDQDADLRVQSLTELMPLLGPMPTR